MKYATLALMGIGLAIGSIAQGQAPAKGEAELKTLEQKVAYAVGLNMAQSLKQQKDQGIDIDADLLIKGLKDGLAGKPALTDQQVIEALTQFRQKLMAKQQAEAPGGAEADKTSKEGLAFLAANKSKPGVITLPSGLQYKVLKAGTGKTPTLSNTFVANYRGTLIDGTEFDSSAKHGRPLELPVRNVIPGWVEALQLMKVGDKWQLFIPSELAYGARPPQGSPIKANDPLIFEMELLDVK